MALIFCDSFDHYATADELSKWTSQGTASSQSISSGNGRRSTSCWRASAAGRNLQKAVASQSTYIAGCAFKVDVLPGSVSTFLSFLEGGTTHVALRLNADGSLTVARNTTALATSAVGIISAGSYYYIELKATVHDTTGTFEVRVDGTPVLIASGSPSALDTRNGGSGVITVVMIEGIGGSNTDFDDLYICDTTGSRNNNFLGDVRIDAYLPNGNGNSSGMTGSDGNSTDNYLLVDESAPDADTTYNESSVVSTKDTYAFANMTHTPDDIFAVQICALAKKDDAGARSIALVTRSGSTDYDGPTEALSTAYLYYMQVRESNPNAASPNDWTSTSVNAAEFGFKVAA